VSSELISLPRSMGRDVYEQLIRFAHFEKHAFALVQRDKMKLHGQGVAVLEKLQPCLLSEERVSEWRNEAARCPGNASALQVERAIRQRSSRSDRFHLRVDAVVAPGRPLLVEPPPSRARLSSTAVSLRARKTES
jgi:hypothetical protein